MAEKEIEVIEIDDSYPSPDKKFTPLRPILCLKNKDQIKKAEEREECFILEFDPYDDLEKLKFPLCSDFSNDEDDLRILAEKGQVACRDYPHPRHTCAKYLFDKTPHDSHCKLATVTFASCPRHVQSGSEPVVVTVMHLTMRRGTKKRGGDKS
ncbi:hypothetical protein OROMI_027504 [Orobanche minor]